MSLRVQQCGGESRVLESHIGKAQDELDREDFDVLTDRWHVVFLEDQPQVFHNHFDDVFPCPLQPFLPESRSVNRWVKQLDHDEQELPEANVKSVTIRPGLVLLFRPGVIVG